MRKLTLLLTLGLFLAAASANACDGDKAACKGHVKGKKTAMKDCTDPKCMKNGKCTMTAAEMAKEGCTMHGTTADMAKGGCSMHGTSAATKAGCDSKATGKHDCCKGKTEGAAKS
ncbi:MAG: hypothetical protein Q8922_12530 [Bacteroidota bacterium]|nr:hypothetical protein [Bacteroidota bacterium]MDP4232221.1 hypothetical protein [Bacteroidota bacterium]MDP4243598.1 hypothetical protein [Bacteroidota bacterium]MDP4288750.1 hypothetical protein [Bacteroidota bacterium]